MKYSSLRIWKLVFLLNMVFTNLKADQLENLSLKGLKSFKVAVSISEKFSKEYEDEGVTEETITTMIERKMRESGMAIATDEEPSGMIGFSINGLKVVDGKAIAASLRLEVGQTVLFYRPQYVKNKIYTLSLKDKSGTQALELMGTGMTWQKTSSLFQGIPIDPSFLKSAVSDLVDALINGYLSVNPKK